METETETTVDTGEEPTPTWQAPPPETYEDVENLVPHLPPDFLKRVGEMVHRRSEADYKSAAKYRRKVERHLKLFSGEIPGKAGAEKNVMYVHYPYLTKAVLLFHSKMHRNSFPATGDICGASILRPNQRDRERRVSRHLNLVLRKRVPEYIPAHDRGGIQRLLRGSAFSVWYYDPIKKRPCFEFALADDVRVPYKRKSDLYDMSDLPRITWRKFMYRHELEAYAEPGENGEAPYYDPQAVAQIYPKGWSEDGTPGGADAGDDHADRQSSSVQKTADDLMGVEEDPEDDDRARAILEHDTHLMLPGDPSKRARPVTICVDEESKRVLRIAYREIDDPHDLARHQREANEHAATVNSLTVQYEEEMGEYQAAMADLEAQMAEYQASGGVTVDDYGNAMLMEPPPDASALGAPPQAPEMPPPPRPARKVPWNRFTHHPCIPNPEGFYSYGLGYLIEGHNITADEVMSLYTSLLRMALRPTYLYSKFAKMPRGNFRLSLGEGHETPLTGDQLQKAIYQFQFPQPDANAFKVEERQAAAVDQITADPIIGGAPGKSGETATESELRASNAMDNISMIHSRAILARSNEIRVLAQILAQTLPSEAAGDEPEVFYEPRKGAKRAQAAAPPPAAAGPAMPPLDGPPPEMGMDPAMAPPMMPPVEESDMEEFAVYAEDYQDDLDITWTADPNLASQPQREQRAMKLFDATMKLVTTPLGPPGPMGQPTAVDPNTAILMARAAAAEVFRAMDRPDFADMAEMAPMPPPPMPPPPPPGEEGGPPEGGSNGIQTDEAGAPALGGAPPDGAAPPAAA